MPNPSRKESVRSANLRYCVEEDPTGGLLAKWRLDTDGHRPARGWKFNGHLGEVMWAFDFLFTQPHHTYDSFGHGLFSVMQLEARCGISFADFKRWCQLATLGHDLGKCGGEFQQMLWDLEIPYQKILRKNPEYKQDPHTADISKTICKTMAARTRNRQAYRHEFMSALIMYHQPEIRAWFENAAGSPMGFGYVLDGAFGHHIKAEVGKAINGLAFTPSFQPLPVFLNKMTKDFRVLVDKQKIVPSPFPVVQDWGDDHPFLQSEGALKLALNQILEDTTIGFGRRTDDDPVSVAIKWVVILADTFGSISQNPDEPSKNVRTRIGTYLSEAFKPVNIDYNKRIVARLFATAEEQRKGGTVARAKGVESLSDEDVSELLDGSLRDFQKQCAFGITDADLIATASTGGGKTVAGLLWAQPHLRLIFTTPTTDTATRLYFDYANALDDTIRHSRAWMDLPRLTNTPSENMAAKDEEQREEENAEQQESEDLSTILKGFEGFDTGIAFTTVDQLLGACAFSRKSVMWLLYIVCSQVVFDEFHSYDSTMLSWYLRFLEWFPGIRTAHLSATVPDYLRARLENTLKTTGKTVIRVSDPAGTGTSRSAPRFRIHIVSEKEAEAQFQAQSLWIVNTVERCQKSAIRNRQNTFTYHSRFRYEDRWTIRDCVVDVFKTKSKDRVIATQVAEMSLDISAMVLISEVCPPESFIQRLGRVNRAAYPDRIADVYVYMPDMTHGLPYSQAAVWRADYARFETFIHGLTGRDISQNDLELAFQVYYSDPMNQKQVEIVHTGRGKTFRRPIRHGSPTVQCILQSDLNREPSMSSGKTARVAVPAILSSTDRLEMRGGRGMHENHFIIEDGAGGEWAYSSEFGLAQRGKIRFP